MALAVVLGALGVPRESRAQADLQAWGNLTFDWIKSHRVTIGVKVEPKVLVSPGGRAGLGHPRRHAVVRVPRGEWFDMVGELMVGRTNQTDDLDSTELTPRIGFRLHLLSNLRQQIVKEQRPKRRLVLRDLLRLEWRNLYYSTDKADSSTVRLRNRLESLWPINRPRITDNGVAYLNADWEWFIPFDDPDERFANRQRVRAGLGYRRSFAWRFEAMYVWNRSRNTVDEPFTSTDHAIDLTMKRVW